MTNPTRILVVEDNDFVRMQIVRFLDEAGYQVFEAIDGSSALEGLKTEPADLLVTDVRMATMDGFELIKALRGQNNLMPVVVVTGDHNPDLLSESSKWHVSAVLMKPVQKDRLLKMVSRAIQQHNKTKSVET
jgi:DNA-binding NtrC family response regulator